MKTVRQYASMLLVAVMLVALAGCSDDGEDMEYQLFGRTWVGDIGMNDDFGHRLYSEFHFDPDGFGEEYQYYMNGDFFAYYRFRWYWEHPHSDNMVLDYGANGVSYMDDVYVRHGVMTGVFFLDDLAPGFPFRLEMW